MMNADFDKTHEILPTGRLPSEDAAKIIGFKKHDIPILIKAKLLRPLGNAPRHAVKYFAASELLKLAIDVDWLNKSTKVVCSYWSKQNKKRKHHYNNYRTENVKPLS